jgi:hypothetical protein
MTNYNRKNFLKGLGAAIATSVAVAGSGCGTLYNGARDLGKVVGLPARDKVFDATDKVARATIIRGEDKVVCEDGSRLLSLYNGIPDRVIITSDGVTRTYNGSEDVKAHCSSIYDNVVSEVKGYISDFSKAVKQGKVELGKTSDGKLNGLEAVVNLGSGIEATTKNDNDGNTIYFGVTKYGNELVTIDGVPGWLSSDLKNLASNAIRQAEKKHVASIVGTSTVSN